MEEKYSFLLGEGGGKINMRERQADVLVHISKILRYHVIKRWPCKKKEGGRDPNANSVLRNGKRDNNFVAEKSSLKTTL